MELKQIATIYTDFPKKFGIPRQSGRAPLMGKIVFLPPYNDRNAFRGIEQFSHLWVLFDFSEAHNGWSPLIRPPKLGGNKKIGVFASRSPFRPNNIGLSSVKLVKVDYTDGVTLLVEGVDILDETPIYDIKPYLKFTDSHPDATCGYADEHSLDSLSVNIPQELLNKLPEDKRAPLIRCLSDDPRPSYHGDGREYAMAYAGFDIIFCVDGNLLKVKSILKK